ncbi:MAG: A/G-specific adenine glycosylase [Anaerolineae bacterium]|nr:A/G-specific adenine glycosylase [Anaerolineae bacterium]
MPTEFARLLLSWYEKNARQLPWRGTHTPYVVWVSEVMLQQTQVDVVVPYFERWLQRFPTLADVAQADEQEVLKYWEGLGYYGRARNFHRAARQVMRDYCGEIPADVRALRRLPGVGAYTAGAILSIAFGQDEAALDANVRRVLARVFDVDIPVKLPEGERRLWEIARANIPTGRAGDYNQAMMDLGATLCSSQRPQCQLCPLGGLCRAKALGIQEQRPVLLPRKQVPHYLVCAAVIARDSRVLIARRPENGLLGGLWEFPGGKVEPGEELTASLVREIREELGADIRVGEKVGVYRHAYSHFKVTLHAFCCSLVAGEPRPIEASEIRWVTPCELEDYPMGKIDRQISTSLAHCLLVAPRSSCV